MKLLRLHFLSDSLRNRLLLYFTLLMMVPLSLAGYLIYRASDIRISDGALRLAAQIVEKNSDSVDQTLTDMQSAGSMVGSDKILQSFIAQTPETDAQRTQRTYAMGQRLAQLSRMYTALNGIYVLLDDGTTAKSRYYSARETPGLDRETYLDVRNHASERWFSSDGGSMVVDNMGDAVLSMACTLPNADSGQPCGIVIVEVRYSYFNRLMRADFGGRGTIFLTDERDGILLSSLSADQAIVRDAAERAGQITLGSRLETIALQDRLLLCMRLPSTGWTVTGVVFKSFLRNDSRGILGVFLTAALLAFIMNIVISRLLANYELRPINQIGDYVRQVERGRFSGAIGKVRPDEIGRLALSVEEMSHRIGDLMENSRREQERMRNAEFKALQAQINPHFLYNSLDSINWLARRGDVQKTTDMVSALTTFFRIGLSKGRDVITLREEMEHVRSYLVIQKIRYETQFDYSIYLDTEAESCYVPKLMLQPLVENALYHGIKLCERRCLLMVNAFISDGTLQIEVMDNGAGMDVPTLAALNRAMAHDGPNLANSYGVVNVSDRIHVLAGERFGLHYTSEKNIGTSVRISLPGTLKGE